MFMFVATFKPFTSPTSTEGSAAVAAVTVTVAVAVVVAAAAATIVGIIIYHALVLVYRVEALWYQIIVSIIINRLVLS